MKKLNLLPPEIKEKRRKKIATRNGIVIAFLMVLLISPSAYYLYYTLTTLHTQEAELAQQVENKYYLITERNDISTEIDTFNKYVELIEGQESSSVSLYPFLESVFDNLPATVNVEAISIDGVNIVVSGTSDTFVKPAEFLNNLQNNELFASANMEYVNTTQELEEMKKFFNLTIQMKNQELE